ncbi:MAG: hypothetical protein FMNOHCHN_03027 [Ignavibacteriaceae bacterium]|nr:hypothetical protein [Ignavibacteriaceae bacterium]
MLTLTQVLPPKIALPAIKPIRSKEDYKAALELTNELMHYETGTEEKDAYQVWVLLIEDYEKRMGYEIEAPPLSYAITEALEEKGLKQADLIPEIGDKTVVSKIVNGKRRPTWEQARTLHRVLGIPVEVFLAEIRDFIVSENEPAAA